VFDCACNTQKFFGISANFKAILHTVSQLRITYQLNAINCLIYALVSKSNTREKVPRDPLFSAFCATIIFRSWTGCCSWDFRKEEKQSSQQAAPRSGYRRGKFYWFVLWYSSAKDSNNRPVCWYISRRVLRHFIPSCSVVTIKPTNDLSSQHTFVVVQKQLHVSVSKCNHHQAFCDRR